MPVAEEAKDEEVNHGRLDNIPAQGPSSVGQRYAEGVLRPYGFESRRDGAVKVNMYSTAFYMRPQA